MFCDPKSTAQLNDSDRDFLETDYLDFWIERNNRRLAETIHDFAFPLLTEPGIFSPSTKLTNSSAIVVRHMPTMSGGKILDIGTGTGVLAIAAIRAGAASVTAIDIDQKAVTLARRNAVANGLEHKINCTLADMFLDNGDKYNGIIANLPLIGKAWNTDDQAIAKLWDRLFADVRDYLTTGGWLRFTLASFADESQILQIMKRHNINASPIVTERKFGMAWSLYHFDK